MSDDGDSEELLQFPSLDGLPRIPKLMTMNAIRLMVEHMLNYAANSTDAYFDVGPMEAMKDGSLRFDYEGLTFKITVEQVAGEEDGLDDDPSDADSGPTVFEIDPGLN